MVCGGVGLLGVRPLGSGSPGRVRAGHGDRKQSEHSLHRDSPTQGPMTCYPSKVAL